MARKEVPGKFISRRKRGEPISERTKRALAGRGFVPGRVITSTPSDRGAIDRATRVSAEAKVRAGGQRLTPSELEALKVSRPPPGPTAAQQQAARLQTIRRVEVKKEAEQRVKLIGATKPPTAQQQIKKTREDESIRRGRLLDREPPPMVSIDTRRDSVVETTKKPIPKGEIKEAPKLTGLAPRLRQTIERTQQEQERAKGIKRFFLGGKLTAQSAALPAVELLTEFKQSVKKSFLFGKALVKKPLETGALIGPAIRQQPEQVVGSFIGTGLFFKGVGKVAPPIIKQLPRIRAEKIKIPTTVGDVTIRTIGIERKGRALPIVTKTPGGVRIGPPRITDPIPLETLTEAVPAPRTAVGTKVLTKVLKTTPEEQARIKAVQEIIRVQEAEKGAAVKDVIFNLETLKKPKKSSQIIIKEVAKEEGVIFGSTTTQQLPEGFRLKPGDVDVVFPTRTEAQIAKAFVPRLTRKLKAVGEDVRISNKNPLIIESSKGEKIIETKSGVDPTILSGDELSSIGALGFDFPDIKAGRIAKTVPFGPARAIKAGEQLTRKGAASLFFRPAEFIDTPKAFQFPGVFPRGRRTKDIPGFIVQTKGITELQKRGISPLRRIKAVRAEAAQKKFIESFTPKQRLTIEELIQKAGSQKATIAFKPELPKPSPIISIPQIPKLPSPKPIPLPSKFPSVFPSPKPSPKISISPRPSPKLSVFPSPKLPSVFPSPRPLPSPRLPKPRPLPSPKPIPLPSAFPSPRPSPDISAFPSPTPSAFPSPRPSPKISTFPSPTPSPRPSPISFTVPPPPPPIGFPFLLLGGIKKPTKESYNVLIKDRQRRKYVKRNIRQHTRQSAIGLGAVITDNSIAQSYKIKKAKRVTGRVSNKYARQAVTLGNKFRQKIRKGKFVARLGDPFIEKRGFAIDTPGEKAKLKSSRVATVLTKGRSIKSLFPKARQTSGKKNIFEKLLK